jgi:hypothetical protein
MTVPVDPANDPHINAEAQPPAAMSDVDNALAARMESLRKTLAELTPEVTKLQNDQKSTWAWLKGGAGFIAFDILVTLAGVILGVNVYSVSHQNDQLITQLQQQQIRLGTSIHETCNLYGTFINFYSPASRDRFAGGAAQYNQLYIVLQHSADNLQCGIKHVVPGT